MARHHSGARAGRQRGVRRGRESVPGTDTGPTPVSPSRGGRVKSASMASGDETSDAPREVEREGREGDAFLVLLAAVERGDRVLDPGDLPHLVEALRDARKKVRL